MQWNVALRFSFIGADWRDIIFDILLLGSIYEDTYVYTFYILWQDVDLELAYNHK